MSFQQLSLFEQPDPIMDLCREALPNYKWVKERWHFPDGDIDYYCVNRGKRHIGVNQLIDIHGEPRLGVEAHMDEGDYEGCCCGFSIENERDQFFSYLRNRCVDVMTKKKRVV